MEPVHIRKRRDCRGSFTAYQGVLSGCFRLWQGNLQCFIDNAECCSRLCTPDAHVLRSYAVLHAGQVDLICIILRHLHLTPDEPVHVLFDTGVSEHHMARKLTLDCYSIKS